MKIAIAQMTSKADPEGNFLACKKMAHKAAEQGAEMVCWPESTDIVFDENYPKKQERADYKHSRLNQFVENMADLAKETSLYLSFGAHLPSDQEEEKWYNAYLTMSPSGKLAHNYNKIHPCVINGRNGLDVTETETCTSGSSDNRNIKFLDITSRKGEIFKLGFAICYDLRYPKFWMELRDREADVVINPACWFFPTRDHWEPLITARAIDNQYYVVCPAQVGVHNSARPASLGQSMILNPSGDKMVALSQVIDEKGKIDSTIHQSYPKLIDEFPEIGEGTCLGYTELELSTVKKVREELPVRQYESQAYGNACEN